MKIPLKRDGSAFIEKRQYGYHDLQRWCITRNGVIMRWLDDFEVDKIESVIEYMSKEKM